MANMMDRPSRCGTLKVELRGRSQFWLLLLLGLSFQLSALSSQAQRIIPSAASVVPAGAPAPLEAKAGAMAVPGKWQLLRNIVLPNPGVASLDRRGTLYVADADNNLRQFSGEGLPLNTYAPTQPGHVAQVEAYNLTNTLVFYDDRQQLILLDRFLAPITELRLADYVDGTVRVATLAPDTRIWLFDESNLVLRQFDPNTLRLVQNTPLDLIIGRSRPGLPFPADVPKQPVFGGPHDGNFRV